MRAYQLSAAGSIDGLVEIDLPASDEAGSPVVRILGVGAPVAA